MPRSRRSPNPPYTPSDEHWWKYRINRSILSYSKESLLVQHIFTKSVMEKKDTIQCRSSISNTGTVGGDLVNSCSAPVAAADWWGKRLDCGFMYMMNHLCLLEDKSRGEIRRACHGTKRATRGISGHKIILEYVPRPQGNNPQQKHLQLVFASNKMLF